MVLTSVVHPLKRRFAPRICPAVPGTLSDSRRNPVRIKSESLSDFVGMRTYHLVAAQMTSIELNGGPCHVRNSNLNAMYEAQLDFDSAGPKARTIRRVLEYLAQAFTEKAPAANLEIKYPDGLMRNSYRTFACRMPSRFLNQTFKHYLLYPGISIPSHLVSVLVSAESMQINSGKVNVLSSRNAIVR